MSGKQTAIITGASGGIGAGLVERLLEEGYNVVATARDASRKLTSAAGLVLVDGDIARQQTTDHAVEAAINNFGTVDVLVNVAGIFLTKPFTDFNANDFDALISTNLLGFFLITQRAVKEMLKQKSGCVISITAALADRPIAGVNGSISMMTKGGLNAATENLAVEYANDGIRFNAVAPGVVDTQMHRNDPNDPTLQPVMKKATVKDIVNAVLYLVHAGHVSGEILHVDGAAPARRWSMRDNSISFWPCQLFARWHKRTLGKIQMLDFDEVGMPRLLSVNVGLPCHVTWNGKTRLESKIRKST
jgi:NAD(P)-dependent dehydrogenase (short-subunit alcohol dehydrogenase family)